MKNLLLPYPVKFVGLFLSFIGILLSILYIWFDFRFTMPVFAVFSSFLETKMFVIFRTNFADEITLIFLVTGISLIVFSKEKNETELLDSMRFSAFTKALISNTIFLLFSILFVFGSGFISILVLNLFSYSLFYLIFFYLAKYRKKSGENQISSK
jgi:hypothetical protein